MMLNGDKTHQTEKSDLKSLKKKKMPKHLCCQLLTARAASLESSAISSTYSSFTFLSCSTRNDEASIRLAPPSLGNTVCNCSTHSSHQQRKTTSLKKDAVCCSRARSLEYFFMTISCNCLLWGKRQKGNKTKKKKTWCVRRKNSRRNNNKAKYIAKKAQKNLLWQRWLQSCF